MARPRVAVVLPERLDHERAALRALAGPGAAAGPEVVVLAGPGRGGDLPRVDAGRLGEALARAREAGGPPRVVVEDPAPLDRARALAREGALDAVVRLGEAPGARLRWRGGAVVIEVALAPAVGASAAPGAASAAAARALARAAGPLRALGDGPARVAALALEPADGEADGARAGVWAAAVEAGRRALAAGGQAPALDLVGPLAPAAAVAVRPHAYAVCLRGQAELALALAGEGPEVVVPLEEAPGAAPAGGDLREAVVAGPEALPAALELVARWAAAAARAGALLAADRQAARAPVVSVVAAQPSAATGGVAARAGNCPYCKRPLDASPADDGARPGPPLACAACGTQHHRDCLAEHGRCTVLGCPGTRALRLGAAVPIAGLGLEAPRQVALTALEGDPGLGPTLWARLEAPIDDPTPPGARALALELAPGPVRRGERLLGHVVVASPRARRLHGGALRVTATLTTRALDDPGSRRTQTILARGATLFGDGDASALGRLAHGLAAWLGQEGGLELPAGTRRWPFELRLPPEHPATVTNRRGGQEERVTTRLEVVVDGERAAAEVHVA